MLHEQDRKRLLMLHRRDDWRGLSMRRVGFDFAVEALRFVRSTDGIVHIAPTIVAWDSREVEAFRDFREAIRLTGGRLHSARNEPSDCPLTSREVRRVRDLHGEAAPQAWCEGVDERLFWNGWISTDGTYVETHPDALDRLFDSHGAVREGMMI